jgi:hypothetical protein
MRACAEECIYASSRDRNDSEGQSRRPVHACQKQAKNAQVLEEFRCTTEQVGAEIRALVLANKADEMRAMITAVGEDPPAGATV